VLLQARERHTIAAHSMPPELLVIETVKKERVCRMMPPAVRARLLPSPINE
jgi:hypothetical protein